MGFVAGAVVGEELLGDDAQAPVVREGAPQEGGAGDAALVGEDLGVEEPRRIIDRDVDVLPASAHRAVAPVAGDAMTNPRDSAQFLDVEVDQLARALPLITDNGRSG